MKISAKALALSLIVASQGVGTDLLAQDRKIRVSVDLGSGEGGQLLGSVVKSALRSLSDIEIVSTSPDYTLDGVVLCDPKDRCSDANAFVGSIRLSRPLQQLDVAYALYSARTALPDSVVRKVLSRLDYFEVTYNTWVINYGRNVYERALRELIAKVDATCFEKTRLQQEIARLPEASRDAAYKSRIIDKQWGC